jgi:hypothetical protein
MGRVSAGENAARQYGLSKIEWGILFYRMLLVFLQDGPDVSPAVGAGPAQRQYPEAIRRSRAWKLGG